MEVVCMYIELPPPCMDPPWVMCEWAITLISLNHAVESEIVNSAMELAIFEDCRNLISHFVRDGDSSFSSFCKQWKKLQFQHIYSAQTTHIETMQTTAAVIHYARRELCCTAAGNGNDSKCPTQDLNVSNNNTTAQHYTEEEIRGRIGCLYLLYAIYFKQPQEQYMKIETSLDTWRMIQTFINTLPMSEDMDAVRYVFYRLLEANAFRFTALNYCVGLEEFADYDQLNEKENTEFLARLSGKELGQKLQDFPATQRILPALSVLEDGYNEMKEMLIKTNTSGMHKKSLPTTTIFKSIEKCFQNIQSILDDDAGRIKRYNSMSEENKRRILKRKSFGSKAIDAEKDGSDEDNKFTKKRKHKTLRRMSARTIFTEKLPADLAKDLEDTSSSDENMETISLSDAENNEESILELNETLDENATEITNESLVDPPKEEPCKLENMPRASNEEEVIEKHLNELLEVELAEEFISIPQSDK